jgi:hypothetical protein
MITGIDNYAALQQESVSNKDDKSLYYSKLFQHLHNARQKSARFKANDEEFYFGDVEETRSQFTKKQLSTIEAKYDIPISTKVNYAIIDQMVSFLTGTQPYLRIIANEENAKQWSYTMEKLQKNVWEESDVAQVQFPEAVRDMIVTGSGYLMVRKNNFFEESTFGVTVQHIPWTNVFADPSSKKKNLSDARCICVAERLQIINAERKYGVTLTEKDADESFWDAQTVADSHYPEWIPFDQYRWKEKRWAWCKDFYELQEQWIFTCPEGYVSLEQPTPTEIPNPEREAALQQYQQLVTEIDAKNQKLQAQQTEADSMMEQGGEQEAAGGEQAIDTGLQVPEIAQMQQMAQQMAMVINQMPQTVPAYTILLENGEEKTSQEVIKIKQKRVNRTVQIGKRIVQTEILPTDQYPIHHFAFAHLRDPNKTYGVTHFIKDIVKAMNKFWGLMIYEMQLNGHGKWVASDASVIDPNDFERKASLPGAVLTYTADPSLPDGGRPEQVASQPLHQGIVQLLSMLLQLAEYVTGIFGVIQGNTDGAPTTLGATQSLQSFGTQRIKLQARTIESALSDLSYSVIRYLQKYCPQDVLAKTIDIDGDGMEAEHLDIQQLTKFKCRTMLSQNLPTSRQMASTLLSTLAGQLADPMAQQLLTQYAMKFLDIQEADEISEQLQVVKQMQGQMEQQGQQIQNLESQLKAASNNLAQKDIAMQAELAKSNIKNEEALAKQEIQMSAETQQNEQQATPNQLPTQSLGGF